MTRWHNVILWCAFAVAVGLGLSIFWLPVPLPASASPTRFSAERAGQWVKRIARAPHPCGSPENRRVRQELVAVLGDLSLHPRVLEGTQYGTGLANIYGELPGTHSSQAPLLLVAHYDSVPSGPGAADDGSGVATVLETIRALKAQGPWRHGIGVLLTDGEERGCLGALAFVRDHPELLRDVRLVVNLEARGNHGPVIMFQTGPDNRRLIQFFRQACPLPVATSFSQDVYSRMPNDTDFTRFLKAGKRGLNFAFVGGLAYYHSPNDTAENLSPRTLQHFGDCVLGIAEHIGRAEDGLLDRLSDPGNATFFPLCRGVLVHYPDRLAQWLAPVAAALFLAALVKGFWTTRLRLRGVAASLALCVFSSGLAFGSGTAAVAGLVHLFKVRCYGPFVIGLPFEDGMLACLLLVAAVITVGLRTWLLRRLTPTEALAGALVAWVALTLAGRALLLGADYLFLWPTLFGALALLFGGASEANTDSKSLCRGLLSAVPAPLLLAPTILLFHQAITLGFAPVSMALTALSISLLPLSSAAQVRQPDTFPESCSEHQVS